MLNWKRKEKRKRNDLRSGLPFVGLALHFVELVFFLESQKMGE